MSTTNPETQNPQDAAREATQCNAIGAAYEVAAGWLLVAATHWRNGDAAMGCDAASNAAQHQEHAQELECQDAAPSPYTKGEHTRTVVPDDVLLRVPEPVKRVLDAIAGLHQ